MPGDIMCYDANGKMILVVEVKDRDLTLLDLQGFRYRKPCKLREYRTCCSLFPVLTNRIDLRLRQELRGSGRLD